MAMFVTPKFTSDDVISVNSSTNPDQDPFAVAEQVRQQAQVRDSQQALATDKLDQDHARERIAAERVVPTSVAHAAPAVNAPRPEDSTQIYKQHPVALKG
jgi:hypothetical protein